ncbi:MAG: hypothetical protein FWG38_01630 [Defluviitaleaceae bacterium]|nr:hypothetical protein [Defluviitaleaceae bacterium]
MKAIINNLLYDTDKATLLHNGEGYALYMTAKGAFFMAFAGSADSDANGTIEIPPTYQVQEMLGKHQPDKYIEIFGEVGEA